MVNEELRLRRGKLAAQGAHAAIGAFLSASPAPRAAWLSLGMPKAMLKCDSMAGLVEIEARARAVGLPVLLVQYAGHTVVPEGTITCLGIGPAAEETFSLITGELNVVR